MIYRNVLTTMREFIPTVGSYWENSTPLFISTSALYRLGKKLKSLKSVLRALSREKLSDLSRRTKDAYDNLCLKQKATLINPTDDAIEAEKKSFATWQQLADIEEKYLQQRAKLHWLEVGDRNNAYFIRSAHTRKMKNAINEVIRPNGDVLKTQEEIKEEAVRFFEDFYNIEPEEFEVIPTGSLQDILRF
ncbi:unnamed protein product [Arabis nemorensis]|uniref:Uncharacterized protein n=1 Tax=Arabis nemorensis TaxID=586526 RepID=A0A565CB48_9BRAS|nr:unnamed protein product [Arabis nemorensis]